MEIAKALTAAQPTELEQVWLAKTALKLSQDELKALQSAREQVASAFTAIADKPQQDQLEQEAKLLAPLASVIKQHINHHTRTGWTSGAHTAVDVPVLAWGVQRADFAGFQDNTDIAAKLIGYVEQAK